MQRTMRFDETPVVSKSTVPLTAKNLAYAQLAVGSESRMQRAQSKLSMASGRLPEAAHCAGPSRRSSKLLSTPDFAMPVHVQQGGSFGQDPAAGKPLHFPSDRPHTFLVDFDPADHPRCREQCWQRRQCSFWPQQRGGRQEAHPATDRNLQQGTGAPAGAAGDRCQTALPFAKSRPAQLCGRGYLNTQPLRSGPVCQTKLYTCCLGPSGLAPTMVNPNKHGRLEATMHEYQAAQRTMDGHWAAHHVLVPAGSPCALPNGPQPWCCRRMSQSCSPRKACGAPSRST